MAHGLPTVGPATQEQRAQDGVRRDVPTCHITDSLNAVRQRVQAAGGDGCVVLNYAGVVLGYLHGETLEASLETTVEQAMDPGPTTIRPHVPLADVVEYLHKRDLDSILVTTADGRLVGVLYAQDAERMLSEAPD